MESEAKDSSQSPSGNRLRSVLTKARRGKKDTSNASAVSVVVTEDSSEGNPRSLRESLDSLRASRQSSLDDGTGGAKLKKLIPGRARRKRKKQEAAEQQQAQEIEEEGRGRDTSDQTATAALRPTANRSHSTLDDGEGSSLITVDSNADS